MSIKLVVFDMAGTTVRDDDFVAEAFMKAMNNYHYALTLEEVNPIMGYKKPVAIRMMLEKHEPDREKITDSLITAIHDDFVQEMLAFYRSSDKITPLPNAEKTFAALHDKGIKIGMNTGFSRDIADIIIERLNWQDKIDILVASDEVEHGRPYPDMTKKMMEQFHITNPEDVAKVGDTEVDINEGKNVGCSLIIGVTTGAFSREELESYKPTAIVDDLYEIVDLITA